MNLAKLPTYDEHNRLQVIVETPRGSRAKISYDREIGIFRFSRALVLGLTYPYDWGFVASTLAPDGDPLDAMIYHEITSFPGLVIGCKAIGVVKLTQNSEKGGDRQSNDRLIVVPADEERWTDATQLEASMREELERFFSLATLATPKDVHIQGWEGREAAMKLVAAAQKAYRSKWW